MKGVISAAFVAGASATWSIVSPAVGTAGFGIGMYDAKNGMMPMNVNGQGAVVLTTTDGGKTWPTAANAEAALMLLSGAGYGSSAVVSGPFNELYSLNRGAGPFNVSANSGMSQALTIISPNAGYAWAGSFGANEVPAAALSTSAGMKYTDRAISVMQTDARYVAAPSTNVIYVSGGTWPDDSKSVGKSKVKRSAASKLRAATSPYTHAISKKLEVTHDPRSKRYLTSMKTPDVLGDPTRKVGAAVTPSPSPAPGNVYQAQIVKSTDGGSTWVSQFWLQNAFYFNGIACQDENNCCAVSEADSDSPAGAGAFILCTTDGGANWNVKVTDTDDGASLMAITVAAPGEYYAVGGAMSDTITGKIYKSSDSGVTWAVDGTLAGSYGTSVTCLPTSQCWATTADILQTSSVARNF